MGGIAFADQHRLRYDAVGDVPQPHHPSRLQAQGLDARQERSVGVEGHRLFPSRDAQIGRAHDHQRHGGVNAGNGRAVDVVDALARRKNLARHRAPRVQEVQQDGSGRAGNAVDASVALVRDATVRRAHRHIDARTGVDIEHAHPGHAVLRLHQALLDAERRHTRQHVAAVRPGVDGTVAHADLREQVVEVAVGLGGARNDAPPCCSRCCRHRRRPAATGPKPRSPRSGPGRGPRHRRATTHAERRGRARCRRA